MHPGIPDLRAQHSGPQQYNPQTVGYGYQYGHYPWIPYQPWDYQAQWPYQNPYQWTQGNYAFPGHNAVPPNGFPTADPRVPWQGSPPNSMGAHHSGLGGPEGLRRPIEEEDVISEGPRIERRGREERSPRGRPRVRQRHTHSRSNSSQSPDIQSPPYGALAKHLYRGEKVDMKDYPHLDRYPGRKSRDAHAFVDSFRKMMALSHASDRVKCLVFPTRLAGPAWDWYSQLPRGSIEGYNDLATKFLGRFGGLRAPTVKCISLMAIKQEPYETSREYLARFSSEVNKVVDFDEKLVLAAVLQGIRSKNLRYELIKQGCETFQKFRECAQQVIQAEEDAQSMGWHENLRNDKSIPDPSRRTYSPPKGRSSSPRNRKRNQKKVIKGATYKLNSYRKTGEAYVPLYSTYHVCTAPRDIMFYAIRESKELEKPDPLSEEEKFDKTVYYEYHRCTGHRTRDCLKLKDEIERLIRQTHLLEGYLEKESKSPKGKGPFHSQWQKKPYNGQWRRENRTAPNRGPAPRSDSPAKHTEHKGDSSPVIMFIAGGDASGGDKLHQRAQYADPRSLANPSRYEIFHLHAEGSLSNIRISFGPEDCAGIRYPHDDAIVLMLRIHGRRVRRILFDTGSSADMLYFEAFRQLNLASYPLVPMDTPLVGFAGDRVIPLGTIELEVEFGENPNSVIKTVKFIVVNAPSAYNAILGRKSLNDLGAVASTKHLMIKFPTRLGVGVVKGDQQKARECYQVAMAKQVAQIDEERAPQEKQRRMPNLGGPSEEVEEVELGQGVKTKIGTALGAADRQLVKECLVKNKEVFAEEGGRMPGIDREVAEHRIKLFPGTKPVHQKKRKFGSERKAIVEAEVQKLLEADFIREVKCPTWLANPVVVPKPDNKWRICIDFTDLNKACPKDPFPLPSIDALVDSTADFTHLSIIDANAGYHQIKMRPEDEEKTSFLTERGIYCYKVIPFGLKNAGAEYQRMVNKLFQEELGKIMEAYIDDMVVKSCSGKDHVEHLDKVFAKMKAVGMRLNPKKSFFCLGSGKFLGFIVSQRGIEIHPSKCRAIMEMEAPKTVKGVQELTGRIAALSRFISKSGEVCLPFFQTIRKNKKFQWTAECQQTFEKINEYLATPPIISRPVSGEVLYLYVAASDTAVSAVLMRIEEGKQKPVYFVSRVLRDAEVRYPPVEKAAFAVMTASRKLRPYFQTHPIKVTAYKGQVLADFLVESTARPPVTLEEAAWEVFVDGASSERGSGVGVEIKGPKGEKFHYAVHLTFEVSNNVAEYETLLVGMRLIEAIGAKKVCFYMDSQLVVNQIKGEYATMNERLALYLEKVKAVMATFEDISVEYVPRTQNETADALSKLAKESDLDREKPIVMLEVPQPSIDVVAIGIYIIDAGTEWIVRAGFYWPSLRKDVEEYVRRCEKCQFHSRIPRQPPHPKQSISSPWPFDMWGIDLLGPFPQGQGNVKFLVVAVEYFTKWIEAKPLATITSQKVVDFVRHQIVYRYGLPHTIISDNGTQFTGAPFQDFCKGLGIRSYTSSVSHPQSNSLAEVSNRTILEGLKKKIEGSKNTWTEYLDEILWAYRTTPRTATRRSPFGMVYGMEAVTPMKIVHPSLRTATYNWKKNGIRREEELDTIFELRDKARTKLEEYQRKMRKNFDRKIAPKHFQPGDWMLRKVEATGKQVGKLDPAWEGPFEVVKSIGGKAYHLKDMKGKRIPNAWNAANLRKFYV
ncbi:hypothetical protein LUZ63_016527 [Rhynchospora breviuscula]|uniref:Uncharacterized protein n=1 Tax=Rhynchospora breviuscula TaxID=2022672 RepID=A0A9P9ZC49_9POAL|nr:hypothetical protein LUZ63_016527 [Rhynchospora breviuscula]